MISQHDVKEVNPFLAKIEDLKQRTFDRFKKQDITPPKWVLDIREFNKNNSEAVAVFTNNPTTKFVITEIDREIDTALKLLKEDGTIDSIRHRQGYISGLESVKAYIDRIETELTKR